MKIKLMCIVLLFSTLYSAPYRVSRIIDGDTIHVLSGKRTTKIRLYGIDAPESEQRYGKYCTKELKRLIGGKSVSLDIKATDAYGRKVAIVYDGAQDINQEMVKRGCAWAYTYYTKKYKADENYAKSRKIGLWADKNPQNPYLYRKAHHNSHHNHHNKGHKR